MTKDEMEMYLREALVGWKDACSLAGSSGELVREEILMAEAFERRIEEIRRKLDE